MEERERLGVLLEHWIAHEREHVEQYRSWAERARGWGAEAVASRLEEAAAHILEAVRCFQRAHEELRPTIPRAAR